MADEITECVPNCPPEAAPLTPTQDGTPGECGFGTFPASYDAVGNPAMCVNADPCTPGGTTLWSAGPCTTTTTVGAATLPITGPPSPTTIGAIGAVLLVAGALTNRVARRV